MKRVVILLATVMLFATSAFAVDTSTRTLPSTTIPGTALLTGPCCISGHYAGTKQDTFCKPGETANTGDFTMDITQAARCGSTFTAKVTDSKDGKITDFAGTVAPGTTRGCCLITGKSVSGTDNINFTGTICKDGLKWNAKGTFKSNRCSGNWNMHQP